MAQTSYLALGVKSDATYNMLSKRTEALFSELRQYLASQWPSAGLHDQRRLQSISGCLEKLSAFLMQAYRMRKYHDALVDLAQKFNQFGDAALASPMAFSKTGREECADFECLLLQARAALDRLTWFIAEQFKQSCSSFSSIENVLSNSMDPQAPKILKIVRKAEHLELSLVGPGNPDPLRDFVAHKGAALEIMNHCFSVYYFGQNRVLISDCEVGDAQGSLPVLKTAHDLSVDLPYVVLNSLAVVCDLKTVSRKWFSPNWQLVSAVFSDFVTDEDTGFQMRVTKRMTPSDVVAANRNVKREILNKTITVDPGPDSFSFSLGQPQ